MFANRSIHRTAMSAAVAALLAGAVIGVPDVRADAPDARLQADLDGRPIALADVGRYDCHDLDYPRIHCFSSGATLDAAMTATTTASSTSYVELFASAYFGGAHIVVSQDYPILAIIGWNDRVSSFKGLNGETGRFHVDWFYGGSSWSFCCNQQVASLGGYNDTFSSVLRT